MFESYSRSSLGTNTLKIFIEDPLYLQFRSFNIYSYYDSYSPCPSHDSLFLVNIWNLVAGKLSNF